MTKNELITRLCALTGEVGSYLDDTDRSYARDCFCGNNALSGVADDWRFEAPIIEFIEKTVRERIGRTAE